MTINIIHILSNVVKNCSKYNIIGVNSLRLRGCKYRFSYINMTLNSVTIEDDTNPKGF